MAEIKWRVPIHKLSIDERRVLQYLTDHADDCGIERTNYALAMNAIGASDQNARTRVSQHLKNLKCFGLVQQVKRYGVMFWNRVPAQPGDPLPDDTYVNQRGFDLGFLTHPDACFTLNLLYVRSPDPIHMRDLAIALMRPTGTMDNILRKKLYPDGWVDHNGHHEWWATEKAMAQLDSVINRDNYFKWEILDYLHANAGNKEDCTKLAIARHFFGPEAAMQRSTLEINVGKPLWKLVNEGYVHALPDPDGKYRYFYPIGSRPKRKKWIINPYGKEKING